MSNDFFDNLNRLCLSVEQMGNRDETMSLPIPTSKKTRRIVGEFVRGPLPLAWFSVAAKLPGKALAVALAIWFESGRKRGARSVTLTTAILDRFAVGRKAKYRALKHLQDAGLITVDQKPRRNPVVMILDKNEPRADSSNQEKSGTQHISRSNNG